MKYVLFFSILACASLFAEREPKTPTEFSGEGLVKSVPDFISLNLTVHSECQLNPKDAQLSTDTVVKKIYDFLNKYKTNNDEHFKILVDGGFTSPYSRWHKDRELCRNTFQKVTTITLKIMAKTKFDSIFSSIQSFVLGQFDQASAFIDQEGPRTFVNIGTPHAEITKTHRKALEKEALDHAVKDAKANFKAAIKSCEPHRWKIKAINEESLNDYRPVRAMRLYAAAMAKDSAGSEDKTAPVRFDEIEIYKSVRVTFSFEGSLCYEP